MGFPLTEEQRAAVEDCGGGLLVSAAAGSGKTRVLVERLLSRVEEEGLDIHRFLVITYTKAAAAELRGRIVEELRPGLAERPGDRHLRRQATLVYQTQISTVHAFCAQLLRECGHLLDLDPDFRLCDESEAGVLMLQAMDDVLEQRYETVEPGRGISPGFWTRWPPGGTTAVWSGLPWISMERCRAIRPRRLAGGAAEGLCSGGRGRCGGDALGRAAAGAGRKAGGILAGGR